MRRPSRLSVSIAAPLAALLTGSLAYLTLGDASAAPLAATGVSASVAKGPFPKLTAVKIRARSAAAMKAAASVHVTGEVVVAKKVYGLDLKVGQDTDGVLIYPQGSMLVRRLGTHLFLSPDDAYYTAHQHPELIGSMHGKWVEIFPADPDYTDILALTSTKTWTKLLSGVPASKRKPGGTIGGIATVAISGGKGPKAAITYVATAGPAFPVFARSVDKLDHVSFTHWNRTVLVDPVAGSDVLPEPPDAVVDIPAAAVLTAKAFNKIWNP